MLCCLFKPLADYLYGVCMCVHCVLCMCLLVYEWPWHVCVCVYACACVCAHMSPTAMGSWVRGNHPFFFPPLSVFVKNGLLLATYSTHTHTHTHTHTCAHTAAEPRATRGNTLMTLQKKITHYLFKAHLLLCAIKLHLIYTWFEKRSLFFLSMLND